MTETPISRIRLLIGTLIAILLAGYVLFQARHVIRGPILTIEYPPDMAVIEDSHITVRGSTKNTVNLLISGRKVFVNEEGVFEETIPLLPGYTIMTIEAEDRYGRPVAREFTLMRVN